MHIDRFEVEHVKQFDVIVHFKQLERLTGSGTYPAGQEHVLELEIKAGGVQDVHYEILEG